MDTQHARPSQAPPGWYPDATGALRWWDGQQWQTVAPTLEPLRAASLPKASGLAVAGLVLGIVGLLAAFTGLIAPAMGIVLSFVPAVLAVTFGSIETARARQHRVRAQIAHAALALGLIAMGVGPYMLISARL